MQCLAHSRHGGHRWTKFAGNPVLDPGHAEFRDPKVFWHAQTSQWIMVVARSDIRAVEFHGSATLRSWRQLGRFGPAGTPGAVWECPDLFALTGADDTEYWVLKVDVFEGAAAGGSGALAFIGQFDGTRFQPLRRADGTPHWQWVDHGRDFYAAVSWTDAPHGRRVWLGWMNSHHYARHMPPAPWRGAMTLPRDLALAHDGDLPVLTQLPSREWDAARILHTRRIDAACDPDHPLTLVLPGTAVAEIALRIATQSARLHIRIGNASGETIAITHDRDRARLTLDRAGTGTLPGIAAYAGPVHAPLASLHDLRIVLDAGSIELFAEHGRLVFTEQLLGAGRFTDLTLRSEGGPAQLAELSCYTLAE